MEPWPDDRVWEAVEAWRWFPAGSTRRASPGYELGVTPGSFALTHAYGLRATGGAGADRLLAELRSDVIALGGTGVRVHLTPRSTPRDLPDRLLRADYRLTEEADVLVWELRSRRDELVLPSFREPPGLFAREVRSDADFDAFVRISSPVFGDPPPTETTVRAFREEFERNVRERGHSDRYLAWDGAVPIGRAGLEIVGPVVRLWGAGVLEAYRRRGAYGLLTRVRCEEGARRGGEIALVTARTGTSGPVLQHHAFRRVGTICVYEAQWPRTVPG